MAQCGFCGKKKSVDAAINAGWYPSYWHEVNGVEVPSAQAACPKDAARHCHDPDNTGELLVRRGHERFLKHDPAYNMLAQGSRRILRKLRGRGRRR